ncbi:hypothetical protein [Sphingomonas sp.]
MNIDTDLVLMIAWMIIVAWAIGLSGLFTAYRRSERAFDRDMERHRR